MTKEIKNRALNSVNNVSDCWANLNFNSGAKLKKLRIGRQRLWGEEEQPDKT